MHGAYWVVGTGGVVVDVGAVVPTGTVGAGFLGLGRVAGLVAGVATVGE